MELLCMRDVTIRDISSVMRRSPDAVTLLPARRGRLLSPLPALLIPLRFER